MKKILLFIPLMAALMIGPCLTTGCQSTPQRVIYNAQQTTQTTVETLMGLWDLKVQRGEATLGQERKIKFALDKYRKTALFAHDLVDAYIRIAAESDNTSTAADIKLKADTAAKEAVTALQELIDVLAEYGVK